MDISTYTMLISHNGKSIDVTMVANDATQQLRGLLAKGNVKVTLHPYGGFERVGALPQ